MSCGTFRLENSVCEDKVACVRLGVLWRREDVREVVGNQIVYSDDGVVRVHGKVRLRFDWLKSPVP